MKTDRYRVQLAIWNHIVRQLSPTSRAALVAALGFQAVDPVELRLLRESAKAAQP